MIQMKKVEDPHSQNESFKEIEHGKGEKMRKLLLIALAFGLCLNASAMRA